MAYVSLTAANSRVSALFPDNTTWAAASENTRTAYLEKTSARFDALPWADRRGDVPRYDDVVELTDDKIVEVAFYTALVSLADNDGEFRFESEAANTEVGSYSHTPRILHAVIADLPFAVQTLLLPALDLPSDITQPGAAPMDFGQVITPASSTTPSGTGGSPTDLTDWELSGRTITVTRRNGATETFQLPPDADTDTRITSVSFVSHTSGIGTLVIETLGATGPASYEAFIREITPAEIAAIAQNTADVTQLKRAPVYNPNAATLQYHRGLLLQHINGEVEHVSPFIKVTRWQPVAASRSLDTSGVSIINIGGRRALSGLGIQDNKVIYANTATRTTHMGYIPDLSGGTIVFWGIDSLGRYQFYNPDEASAEIKNVQDANGNVIWQTGDWIGYAVSAFGSTLSIKPAIFRADGTTKIECNNVTFTTTNSVARYIADRFAVASGSAITDVYVATHTGISILHADIALADIRLEGLGLRTIGTGRDVLTQTVKVNYSEGLQSEGKNVLTEGDMPGTVAPSIADGSVTRPKLSTAVQNELTGKANSADLADVATSGSYNDLSDKPTIPSGGGGSQNDPEHIRAAWFGGGDPRLARYSVPAATILTGNPGTVSSVQTGGLPSGYSLDATGLSLKNGAVLRWTNGDIDYSAIKSIVEMNVESAASTQLNFFFGMNGWADGGFENTSSGVNTGIAITFVGDGGISIYRADTNQALTAAGAWGGAASRVRAHGSGNLTLGEHRIEIVWFKSRVIIRDNGKDVFDVFLPSVPTLTGDNFGVFAWGGGSSSATSLKLQGVSIEDVTSEDIDPHSHAAGDTTFAELTDVDLKLDEAAGKLLGVNDDGDKVVAVDVPSGGSGGLPSGFEAVAAHSLLIRSSTSLLTTGTISLPSAWTNLTSGNQLRYRIVFRITEAQTSAGTTGDYVHSGTFGSMLSGLAIAGGGSGTRRFGFRTPGPTGIAGTTLTVTLTSGKITAISAASSSNGQIADMYFHREGGVYPTAGT